MQNGHIEDNTANDQYEQFYYFVGPGVHVSLHFSFYIRTESSFLIYLIG